MPALSRFVPPLRPAVAAVTAAATTFVLVGTTAAAGVAATPPRAEVAAADASGPGLYLVLLDARPAAAYDGRLPGFPATRPEPGERFDRSRPEVGRYAQRLRARQDEVLARVGSPEVSYRFTTALNGFAATLTSRQVKQLRATEGVTLVERSTKRRLDTVTSPDFLGLTGADGVWAEHGGPDRAGDGVVVGIIDSGIWPENPSFAGVPLRGPDRFSELPGFHGACERAEQWTATDCNSKVVSARYFVKGFGRENLARAEYLSPRDGNGHGSHTASIAAGNEAVPVAIEGQQFGDAAGMAPAARIAAYKACWVAPNPEDDGCTTADTAAAIDAAVADGVDVINYSISGAPGQVGDAVGRAFLNAAAAGVFVATSAGNQGPASRSVGHAAPWVTTVGASTHQRLQAAVSLADGESFVGTSVADTTVPATQLVLAADAAGSLASPEEAALCALGSLDASAVQGKIVVCDRGVTARVEKSRAVARAGGVAMVLVNTDPDSLDADFHSVPTVHVDTAAGAAIKSYVEKEGDEARASIDPTVRDDTEVPQVAGFSSRGPAAAAGGDLVKPDLTAPGVGVVAAVAPPSNDDRLWDLSSGTSMSAPHVAGLAAFVAAARPDWTPAQVKSAMMTTAYDLEGHSGPFTQGAGHVDPADVLDPALVYGSIERQWRKLLDGRLRGRDVNLPSIAVGGFVGRTQVTRKVTNVSGSAATFNADVTGVNGVEVDVVPDQLLLQPGETARFRVRFRTTPQAQLGSYAKGHLTWTGLTGHDVRIPVAVRPLAVTAPAEVAAEGTSSGVTITGRSGSGSELELSMAGLVGALPTAVSLSPGRFDPERPKEDADTLKTSTVVPAGAEVVRFLVDGNRAADDLDLFVYLDGELVAVSAGASADETVTLLQPEAGRYDVYTASVPTGNDSTTTGRLFSWVVGAADTGALELSPARVDEPVGQRFSFRAAWDPAELDLTQRWFGAIRYGSSDRRTLITVN